MGRRDADKRTDMARDLFFDPKNSLSNSLVALHFISLFLPLDLIRLSFLSQHNDETSIGSDQTSVVHHKSSSTVLISIPHTPSNDDDEEEMLSLKASSALMCRHNANLIGSTGH